MTFDQYAAESLAVQRETNRLLRKLCVALALDPRKPQQRRIEVLELRGAISAAIGRRRRPAAAGAHQ